jgi:hypothetical protein
VDIHTNTSLRKQNRIYKYKNYKEKETNILIIPELIILLMNTVRCFQSLVNVIVFCWILTSSDGLMNSISELTLINDDDNF